LIATAFAVGHEILREWEWRTISTAARSADYWLLVHPDLKAVPRVRHVMERICGVFRASRAALGG